MWTTVLTADCVVVVDASDVRRVLQSDDYDVTPLRTGLWNMRVEKDEDGDFAALSMWHEDAGELCAEDPFPELYSTEVLCDKFVVVNRCCVDDDTWGEDLCDLFLAEEETAVAIAGGLVVNMGREDEIVLKGDKAGGVLVAFRVFPFGSEPVEGVEDDGEDEEKAESYF